MAIIEYLNFDHLNKDFWLLDTFQGIDRALLTDKEREVESGYLDYVDSYERVKRTFSRRDYVKIVRGSVPGTLPNVTAKAIAFLHLDMNAVLPEVAAIEHFWPLMSSGAVVILDDYGWPRHREQKAGIDAFAARIGVDILQLPTGQGVAVKP